MKSRMFCLMLAITFLSLFFCLSASAAEIISSGTCGANGDNLTWTIDDEGTLTISGTGEMNQFECSSDNMPWSSKKPLIQNVIISYGITNIGNAAFYNCENLTAVVIPDTVTSIGDSAFYGCSQLTSITIPDTVDFIGSSAFFMCNALYSIHIPACVTRMGEDPAPFVCCYGLTNITVDYNNTKFASIGGVLFDKNISKLLCYPAGKYNTTYIIPYGVDKIVSYAFYGCTNLDSIAIPNTVNSIGFSAFAMINNLNNIRYTGSLEQWNRILVEEKNYDLLSNNIIFIDDIIDSGTFSNGFSWTIDKKGVLTVSGTGDMTNFGFERTPWEEYKNSIKTVTITDGVTSIGSSAFCHCDSLINIILPDSLQKTEADSFSECTSLTCITIPKNVINIGKNVFYSCTSLSRIAVSTENQEYCSVEDVLFNKNMTRLIRYPCCKKSSSYDIPDSVLEIADSAFERCEYLTRVTIPNSVNSIGNYAFFICSNLTSLVIPDSVKNIGEAAFCYCHNLIDLTLSNNINTIEEYTFKSCHSLTKVIIPKSVTSIGDYVFCDCPNLAYIEIPDSILSIGNECFSVCNSLTNIIIPKNVSIIGNDAFFHCSSLTGITVSNENRYYCSDDEVLYNKSKTELICYPAAKTNTSYTIPSGVTSIGNDVFYSCKNLTSIIIPSSVMSIGDNAFAGCSNLINISIPKSVTSIGSTAFCECTSLKSIAIPDNIQVIVFGAFSNCTNLSSVIIPSSVTTIDFGAFCGCKNLKAVVLPEGINKIDFCAFKDSGVEKKYMLGTKEISIDNTAFEGTSPIVYCYENTPNELWAKSNGFTVFLLDQQLLTLPSHLTEIGPEAFAYLPSVKAVRIPTSVTSIADDAFSGSDVIILAPEDSYAVQWAKEHGIDWIEE